MATLKVAIFVLCYNAVMATIVLVSQFTSVKEWVINFLNNKDVSKIAYIIDAKKPRLEVDPEYVFVDKSIFEEAGFEVIMIDLESTQDLERVFDGVDVIYVKGGNSFYLLNAMRQSGFDLFVEELLEKGLIYLGESAGAYVACPTIEMARWKHQDRDIVGLEDLTALGIVPFVVSAHYEDSLKETLEPHVKGCKYKVELLRDNEVIIYENQNPLKFEVNS